MLPQHVLTLRGATAPKDTPILHLANRNNTDHADLSKNKKKYSRKGSMRICVTLSMDIYGLKLTKDQEHREIK
jgi:hypothetical protein